MIDRDATGAPCEVCNRHHGETIGGQELVIHRLADRIALLEKASHDHLIGSAGTAGIMRPPWIDVEPPFVRNPPVAPKVATGQRELADDDCGAYFYPVGSPGCKCKGERHDKRCTYSNPPNVEQPSLPAADTGADPRKVVTAHAKAPTGAPHPVSVAEIVRLTDKVMAAIADLIGAAERRGAQSAPSSEAIRAWQAMSEDARKLVCRFLNAPQGDPCDVARALLAELGTKEGKL